MGLLAKLALVLVAVGIAYVWRTVTEIPPLPQLERTWWAAGKPVKQDQSIRPFKINVPDKVLVDLEKRLALNADMTPPLEGVGFEYGFNTNYLQKVVDFWRKDYKWREREVFLNKFPHFKTRVSGLDLHFIHVKPTKVPEGTRVLPMMLLHGWPGSVREFYSLIPLLTTPRKGVNFVFEIIAPSLPGYGFSEGAAKPGMGPAQVGVIMNELMERLGHNKYFIQGGDWGSAIATAMANFYPENVLGIHLNMCMANNAMANIKTFFGSFWHGLVVDEKYAHRMYPFFEKFQRFLEEMGYMHIQATKPDTVGVALKDSPVGLAAYILEKFSTWTDPEWRHLPDGGLTKKFTLTDVLDNIMIYWVTGSITTSVRLYSEFFTKANYGMQLDSIPVQVPTACAIFPNELAYQSEYLIKEKYPNLVRFTHMPSGGHFAAFEEPQALADDVWETVSTIL